MTNADEDARALDEIRKELDHPLRDGTFDASILDVIDSIVRSTGRLPADPASDTPEHRLSSGQTGSAGSS